MKKFDKNKYLKKLKLHRWWQNYSKYFYIGIPYLLCLVLGYQYGKSSYESMTMVFKNNHYVIGNLTYGIYAFVEDTNNINNGYPILKWQTERENN